MSNEAPRPLAVVRTAADLLDEAAGRAVRQVTSVVTAQDLSWDNAAECMETILSEVRRRIQDPSLGHADPGLRADPLFGSFLDAIVHELIVGSTDPAHAPATLQALGAIDTIRRAGGVSGALDPESSEELRARLRAPDAFELLVEVAHDFRSPLSSILFLAETLRDGNSGDVTELQRSQLGLIYSAAFGLASVASDVMDLARREHDLIGAETQPYLVSEVFDSVRRLVNPIVEEKGLELRLQIPDRARADGHPHALSRVLLNLTTNALKFTDEGHVALGVRPLPRSRLEFYVQDTGRGIPADRRPELFRPFKRRLGENQGGHFFSGSGVGLSIARRLVRAMGSDLVLESSDEQGTRFSFMLPQSPERPTP